MIARLKGGPYDGIELDHNDINLYTAFTPIGRRQFLLMPPFDKWNAVRRGEIEKDADFGMRLVYELVRTPPVSVATFDPDGKVFADAVRDQAEGRGPAFVPPPFTGVYYQCVRGDWALTQAGRFSVTDEKGRKWACLQVSKEEGEQFLGGYSELSQAHDASESTERLQVSTLWVNSADELPVKLADIID